MIYGCKGGSRIELVCDNCHEELQSDTVAEYREFRKKKYAVSVVPCSCKVDNDPNYKRAFMVTYWWIRNGMWFIEPLFKRSRKYPKTSKAKTEYEVKRKEQLNKIQFMEYTMCRNGIKLPHGGYQYD